MLWLNGGPGASSMVGLLAELGPCLVTSGGDNVAFNPHAWNQVANLLFLDQPVDVGYSYTDGNVPPINSSESAAEDVDTFIQHFLARYPQYAKAPFHIAAESHGGMYAPAIASEIHRKNNAARLSSNSHIASSGTLGRIHVNIASLMIGNGYTEPYTQTTSIPEAACEGIFPVYDDPAGPECDALRTSVRTCLDLLAQCRDYGTDRACSIASKVCWNETMAPIVGT